MQYKDRVQYIDEQTGCPHCQKEKGDALLLSQACEEKVKVFNVKDNHYCFARSQRIRKKIDARYETLLSEVSYNLIPAPMD